jgi:hypothetical protein
MFNSVTFLYALEIIEPIIRIFTYISIICLSYWGIRALKIYIDKR